MQQQRGVFGRLDRGADDRYRRHGPYRQRRISRFIPLLSRESDFEAKKSFRRDRNRRSD